MQSYSVSSPGGNLPSSSMGSRKRSFQDSPSSSGTYHNSSPSNNNHRHHNNRHHSSSHHNNHHYHQNSNNSNTTNSNNSNPHHKKAKYHPSRNQTTLETVVDYIFGLPTLNHTVIEFRTGRKSAAHGFAPFMSELDFDTLLHYIKKAAKSAPPYEEYIYERGRYLHSRLTANESGMVTAGVYKEKLATFDMETNLHAQPPHPHIRIDIMKESPIVPIPVSPEEGYLFVRKKTRYTIETKDWLLHLFDVTTTYAEDDDAAAPNNGLDDSRGSQSEGEGEEEESSGPRTSRSFELEAQVKIASLRNVPDKKACVDLLDNVFVEVHNLLARLQQNGAQLFPDLKLERIARQDHYHYLKSQFMQVVPNANTHHHRFPGSLPSGLERNKIKFLQKGDYWVSEKSDGLRYLLFIIDRGAYLVDRRMDFYQIHKFPILIELFGTTGVTLLDGEMVRNLRTGKLMYLIFDILALNGQTNIGMYNLPERLGIIGKKVVTVFRDAAKEKGKEYSSKLQFTLSGKIFRPKNLVKELAAMIKHNDKGERFFVDDKRYHRNDGLIFTPSGPYIPYSSSHLMKWKYCDRLTIDFLFKFTDEGHVALVGKGGDVMIDWPDFDMTPEDWGKLTSSLAKTIDPSQAVIECAYDNETDKWRFITLRPDKDRPNHLTTVQHTLFIVKENITLEELVYRIPKRYDHDDWEQLHPEICSTNEEISSAPSSALSSSSSSCLSRSSDELLSDESSPTVDLPSTPLPSPIVCKSTPPSSCPSSSLSSSSSSDSEEAFSP